MLRNLNQLVDALQRQGLVNPQLGQVKSRISSFTKARDAGRRCMWPGCRRRPIDSHVISHTFLECLGPGGGKLKAPKNPEVFVSHASAPRIEDVAASAASTFPGFCAHHDVEEFKGFELARRMETCDDVRRQLIRTVSLELQNREDNIDLLVRLQSRKSGAERQLRAAGIDASLETMRQQFKAADALRTGLLRDLDVPNSHAGSVAHHRQVVQPGVGVALSYVDFFPATDQHTAKWGFFPVAVAIVPLCGDQSPAGSSALVLAGPHERGLEQYVEQHLAPASLESTIRSWMTKGCFSWWASPTWWGSLSPGEQTAVEVGLTRFDVSAAG